MAPSLDRRKTILSWISVLWTIVSVLLALPAVNADKTAADYYVHSLPGAPDGPLLKMHAG